MDHDQNFKDLILDFPQDAFELFAGTEAEGIERGSRIIPIRKEQLKVALSDETFVLLLELTSVRDLAAQAPEEGQEEGEYARVPVRLKSFFQILYGLSGYVQATSREEQKRIARPYSPLKGELASRQGLHSGLIKIKSASAPPEDAYVAINYRDRHYYIPDRDINSKAYLMLIESIFSLLSGDVQSVKPLITIPVGG